MQSITCFFLLCVFIVKLEMMEEECMLGQLQKAISGVCNNNKTTDNSITFCTSQEAAATVAMFHYHPKFIIDFVKNKGYLSTQLAYLESVVKAMKEDIESSPYNNLNSPSPVTEERDAMRREAALKRRTVVARRTSEDSLSSFDTAYLSSAKAVAGPIFNIVKKQEATEVNDEDGELVSDEKEGDIVDKTSEMKEECLREAKEQERLRRVELAKLEVAAKKNAVKVTAAEPAAARVKETEATSTAINVKSEEVEKRAAAARATYAKRREVENKAAVAKATYAENILEEITAAAKAAAARGTENRKEQLSMRDEKKEKCLGKTLAKALTEDEGDASMPYIFDESQGVVNQQQASKTSSFLCRIKTAAAAAAPSRTGNSSGSCVITRRRSHNEGGEESLFDRQHTRTVLIPRRKLQDFY
nr:MAG: hypothetical protein [Hemigrapsus takanoi nimavirus]